VEELTTADQFLAALFGPEARTLHTEAGRRAIDADNRADLARAAEMVAAHQDETCTQAPLCPGRSALELLAERAATAGRSNYQFLLLLSALGVLAEKDAEIAALKALG
jgi:hypothetical protein